jgi:UDP-N-acetylmuramate: L-alanyl-gamma-D-glutamyl-meso-diaminopimelate ligase
MKKMPPISPEEIKAAFKNDSLEIFTEKAELEKFLKAQNWYQSNLLLMTSGTFGGMNFNEFGSEIASLKIEKVEREVEPIVKKKRSWKLFGKR